MEKLSKALEKFAEPERRKRSDQMKSVLADIDRAAKLSDGQKKEFDYSGTQACKALREEGYE